MANESISTDRQLSKGNGKWSSKDSRSQVVNAAVDTAREVYDTVVEQGSELASRANKKANQMIKNYPMQSTLGGVLLGFFLGALVFKRHS